MTPSWRYRTTQVMLCFLTLETFGFQGGFFVFCFSTSVFEFLFHFLGTFGCGSAAFDFVVCFFVLPRLLYISLRAHKIAVLGDVCANCP